MTAGTAAPLVTLPHGGQLRGLCEQGVRVFRGVRYAQAPSGALRFAAPVPASPWPGVRDATEFAPMAPQLARTARADAPMLGGEDCLAVNVWAPPAEPGARLPVMVWVHGGGFFRGAASEPLYDGASFARQGVVFVSLQYRLGIDGFLHFDDEGEAGSRGGATPANRGLLDLLAALQWVCQPGLPCCTRCTASRQTGPCGSNTAWASATSFPCGPWWTGRCLLRRRCRRWRSSGQRTRQTCRCWWVAMPRRCACTTCRAARWTA